MSTLQRKRGAMTAVSRVVPVADLLDLRSGEARLLCSSGHVAGHPNYCPDGCQPFIGAFAVRHVLPFKDHRQIERVADAMRREVSLPLISVEDGWLVNGHHRIAAAVLAGVTEMSVIDAVGILARQQEHHQRIRDKAFTRHQGAVRVGV